MRKRCVSRYLRKEVARIVAHSWESRQLPRFDTKHKPRLWVYILIIIRHVMCQVLCPISNRAGTAVALRDFSLSADRTSYLRTGQPTETRKNPCILWRSRQKVLLTILLVLNEMLFKISFWTIVPLSANFLNQRYIWSLERCLWIF